MSFQFEALLKDMKKQRIDKNYLRKLKNSLCLGDEYINRFIKSNNALELLLSVALRNYDSLCQLEALACLTNLVCGDHKATYRVLRSAGPYVVTFLNGSSPFLQNRKSMWQKAKQRLVRNNQEVDTALLKCHLPWLLWLSISGRQQFKDPFFCSMEAITCGYPA
ncbi:hypothetical protein HPB48_016117 [Haemaphysalis longicornis]|uniref:Uncharacterized protein n=1 Tax=Haemaphysalis longicornis TaxID=44386 RepID=A0A9J6GSE0_HAELO|nr:hypothetical protein HPB48_016117 [Haemaphysalis longicornis]